MCEFRIEANEARQMRPQRAASDWEALERTEHDEAYALSLPFASNTFDIDPAHIYWWQDYWYKKKRRTDRGHRTRRLLDRIPLSEIRGKTVLDVGCGNGQYTVFFALCEAEAYGCDISPIGIQRAIAFAQANGVEQRCHCSVQNISGTGYANAAFDIIILHEVLHHAIKYPGVREELVRLAKPGGRIIGAEALDGNPLFRIGRKFTMRGKESLGDVVLTLEDIERFGTAFSSCQVEPMSLLFMLKRPLQRWVDRLPVRILLYLLKRCDDLLLLVVPPLRRFCGECVFVFHR
jgi:2-polyprenyl-3-methyl-5-hydroxy-6-metoxy-1,4-benzoquinol methylase